MKANINITPIKVFQSIPNFWNNTFNYAKFSTEKYYEDGWRNVVTPSYSNHQYLGELYYDQANDVFTYPIMDYSAEDIEKIEQDKINNAPTLAALYASEIGYSVNREIDIQIDQLEIFTPKEKVYHLLGHPLFKEYFKDDVCVCRLEYQKVYEDKTHEGITKNEFVGTKTVFKFYKDEAKEHFITKEKQTKTFALVPTPIHDENNNVIDVLWSSADREGLLRSQRYKSEQVMKSFNPSLYQLFVALWNDLYMNYKETGENTELVAAVSSHPLPKLDEEVEDDDKAIIFGPLEAYPPLTIRQLIITALP